MNPAGLQISTLDDRTIVLVRTFNAARRLVWEAFFVPGTMRRWMLPPPGMTLSVCECEARAGGRLRLAWTSAEADPAMTLQGVFKDVAAHERATHTETMVIGGWEGAGQTVGSLVETHEFAESDGATRTTMRITQVYPSKEERDGALASGMNQWMETGYSRLDEVLSQLA